MAELFPYQKEAEDAILRRWCAGIRALLLSMPTGSGKTITFAHILRTVLEGTKMRALILVHRDELLEQAKEKIETKVWPGVPIGLVYSKEKDFTKPITIASVQTLARRLHQMPPFDYICTDEAHHSVASQYVKIYNQAKALNPHYRHLGVTATPVRASKKESLSDVFDEIGYSISLFRLIQEGFLADIKGYAIATSLDLSRVKTTAGDYDVNGLSRAVATGDFNDTVVQNYLNISKGEKAICFAVDVNHTRTLTKLFKRNGVKAASVDGGMAKAQRNRIISDYRKGKIRVLVNCMICTEGFDDPPTTVLLLARPTKSMGLYTQMCGRGLRLHPGKKFCTLLDFTDSARTAGLVTLKDVLSFYGMPENVSKAVGDYATSSRAIIIDRKTISSLNMLKDMGEAANKTLDFFDVNSFAWSSFDRSRFVSVRKNISMGIVRDTLLSTGNDDHYNVYICRTEKGRRWFSKVNDTPTDYDFALGTCNVLLYEYGDKTFAAKEMQWRTKAPSVDQKNYLQWLFRAYKNVVGQTEINPFKMTTSGEYASFITAALTMLAIKEATELNKQGCRDALMKEMILEHFPGSGAAAAASVEPPEPVKYKLNVAGNINEEAVKTLLKVAALLGKSTSAFPLKFYLSAQIEVGNSTICLTRRGYPTSPLSLKQKDLLQAQIGLALRYYSKIHTVTIGEPQATANEEAANIEKEADPKSTADVPASYGD